MPLSGLHGLSHIFLNVSDIDRSKRFYRDVFGWQELFDDEMGGPEFEAVVGQPGAAGRTTGGRIGDLRLEMTDMNWQSKAPWTETVGLAGFTFEVADAVKAWEDCTRMGVPTSGRPHEVWGCSIFFLEDPDGQRIEIVQYHGGTAAWGGEGGRPELR